MQHFNLGNLPSTRLGGRTITALFASIAAVVTLLVLSASASAAPNPQITSPSNNSVFATNTVAVTWTETSGEATSVDCTLDGFDQGCTLGNNSIQLQMLTEGFHTFEVSYNGGAASDSVDFEVDTAPVIVFPLPELNTAPPYSGDLEFDFHIYDADLDGSSIDCQVGGGASVTCTQIDPINDPSLIRVAVSGVANPSNPDSDAFPLTVTASDSGGGAGAQQSQATLPININNGDDGTPFFLEVIPSSTRAGRHPDLMLDLRSGTNQDPQNVVVAMPEGFAGSLNTVSETCPWPDNVDTELMAPTSLQPDDAAIDSWCSSTNRANAKIGEALVEGIVDGNRTKLAGDIYMTESPMWGEVAGIVIDVPAEVGGLDLGHVLVGSHLSPNPADSEYDASEVTKSDIAANPKRVVANIYPIPNTIKSVHGETEFTMKRSRIWLRGENSGTEPLITNPSNCTPTDPLSFKSSVYTYDGSNYELPEMFYEVTDCADQPFDPTMSIEFYDVFDPENPVVPVAGQNYGMRASMVVPDGSTTLSTAIINMPASVKVNLSSLSVPPLDKACSYSDAIQNPPNCDGKQIGFITVQTPLLQTVLQGDLFYVPNQSGGDAIYAVIRDESLGIHARIRGRVELKNNLGSGQRIIMNQTHVAGSAVPLPDLPVSRVDVDITGPIDTGPLVQIGLACRPMDAGAYRLLSHTGRVKVGTIQHEFSGCDAGPVTITPAAGTTFTDGYSNGMGGVTTDSTPSFNIKINGAVGPSVTCKFSVDNPNGIDGHADNPDNPDYNMERDFVFGSPVSCPNAISNPSGHTFNVTTPLKDGVHSIAVDPENYTVGGNTVAQDTTWINFIVDSPTDEGIPNTPPDTAAPETNITNAPPATPTTTTDRQPVIDFDADGETADYSCRLVRTVDSAQLEESFQPCGWDSDTGQFQPAEPLDVGTYTFEVRAEDGVGNVDATPASTEFEVKLPFGPAWTVTPSTTQARAHPTLDVHLESESNDDLRTANFSMPTGFVGSLLGAAQRCTAAQAQAAVSDGTGQATCPAASKVGSLSVSAQADFSKIKLDGGEIFLTEPLVDGDPAGLVIRTPAKVGAIDVGAVSIRQRLMIRGNAEGVDAVSLDPVPNSTVDENPNPDQTLHFHFRSMDLKLSGGAGATQPLLTNPSNCSPTAFKATFGSYSNATASSTDIPFQATGCDALPFYTAFTANIERLDANSNPTGQVPRAGDTTRFTGTIAASPDDAGVRFARLELPKSLTVDASGKAIPIGCSFEHYQATKTCDQGDSAVIGTATATTPLLPSPLEGKVYLGKPDPAGFIDQNYFGETVRIIIQMRGLVDIDLVGRTTLQDFRPVTVFENIPDAPVNAFTVNVDKIVRVRPTACDEDLPYRTITGYNLAHNDKTSNYNTDVSIDCAGGITAKASIGGKGKKAKANITAQATGGARLKRVEVTLPKGLTPVKKAFKKKVQVIADGKRLKGCAKLSRSKVIVDLCGKTAKKVELRFNPGSLVMKKKLKKATFNVKSTLDNGRIINQQIKLGKSLKGSASNGS